MVDSSHEDIDAMSLLEAMTESVLVTTTDLDSPGPSIVYVNPDSVVKMLNTYYTTMVEVINAHEGTVAQFVGDEIFAIFEPRWRSRTA